MAKKNFMPASLLIFTLLTWWLLFTFSRRGLQWNNAGFCDVSVGKWEYHPWHVPGYTNESCRYIHPSQNCFKNGRPDREYLKWKWKPRDCDLEFLDPAKFLNNMRNKQMVFIGDSLARNHMQSLLCSLNQVETPEKIYHDNRTLEIRWRFPSYNFVLADMWSPFLVQFTLDDETQVHKLQLDIPERDWTSKLYLYDVAVISSGYWYFRPCLYYMGNRLLGNNSDNSFGMRTAYMKAHEQVLKFMREEFRGITVLRTITVDHFENGSWDSGGFCNRTAPLLEGDSDIVPWMNSKMREIQVREFYKARKNSRKMRLLDVTLSVAMRPDAHPGVYRMPDLASQNDCLHWCMPGAIDTWNQLLFHILYK